MGFETNGKSGVTDDVIIACIYLLGNACHIREVSYVIQEKPVPQCISS